MTNNDSLSLRVGAAVEVWLSPGTEKKLFMVKVVKPAADKGAWLDSNRLDWPPVDSCLKLQSLEFVSDLSGVCYSQTAAKLSSSGKTISALHITTFVLAIRKVNK